MIILDINSKTWEQHVNSFVQVTNKYPLGSYVLKPGCRATMKFWWFLICFLFLQLIPALAIDLIMFIMRKKPM